MTEASADARPTTTAEAPFVPLRKMLRGGLLRDPLQTLIDAADEHPGKVVQLSLGTVRAFLVSEPRHVQHVLRDNAKNYTRAGDNMLYKSVRKLSGEGIFSEGEVWEASRRRMQPHFTAKRIDSYIEPMSRAVNAALDDLAIPAEGATLDAGSTTSRIICQTMTTVFFGGKIPLSDAMTIIENQEVVANTLRYRLLVPFYPNALPFPGDFAFARAVKNIDAVVYPLIRKERANPSGDPDALSTLATAVDDDGNLLPERQVRDDIVSIFATTTETTYNLLAWLWPVLEAHPAIAARMQEEIDSVVRAGEPITQEQLGRLRYSKMVMDELVRLYPSGWLIPRTSVEDDVIDGVHIPAGSHIALSPVTTHRLRAYWDRPNEFDPERFAPEQPKRQHRYAYYPFGGGGHQCIGMYLFGIEAPLVAAAILARYRVKMTEPGIPDYKLAASLRPNKRIYMTVTPAQQPVGA